MHFKSVHHSFKLTWRILLVTFALLIFSPELWSIRRDEYVLTGGMYLMDFDEFPYAAKIQTVSTRDKNIQETKCSAVVYGANWAITAAHCFEKSDLEAKNFKNYTIVAGWIDSVIKSPIEEVFVPDKSQHPELYKGEVVEHDIALVKTTYPIAISHLQISLPRDVDDMNLSDLRDETLYLYSFGSICFPPDICPADKTKKVYKTFLSKNIGTGCPMDDSKICAEVQYIRGFTGPGDSGGPLVKFIDNSTCVLIGILTLGEASPDTYNKINVYSNISHYENFIVRTIRENMRAKIFRKSLYIIIFMLMWFLLCVLLFWVFWYITEFGSARKETDCSSLEKV